MRGLNDLHIERFGANGWFFAVHKTVPGLTLFAPTLEEVAARLPGALALVTRARLEDLQQAVLQPEMSWHVANDDVEKLALAQ